MAKITGSVGSNGDNLSEDVLCVQRLLNRHDLSPLQRLEEDGRAGPRTVECIRHFQTRYLGMNAPDGRVDPDGRTLRKLDSGGGAAPLPRTGENAETRRVDREARAQFVDGRVKETAVTTRIIDALMPRFAQVRARVIAGYLSDTDQFWKVNYHWEYLLDMATHAMTLPVEEAHAQRLSALKGALLACKPNPSSGYTSGPVGKPEDDSSMESMLRRHQILSQQKREFATLTEEARLKEKSRRTPRAFDLAAAPVARPGTSKHGTGYALDIEGDNSAIKSTCQGLGATLVFDEKSHVHVEFKNGVPD